MPEEGNSMKGKLVLTEGLPAYVVEALSSRQFAEAFLADVIGGALGVENPAERPAEFYMQKPDTAINTGHMGVELRLTGVSRNGRKAKQFHEALRRMHEGTKEFLARALRTAECSERIQIFAIMMIDGDVETFPGSGVYSNMLEHHAEWVEAAAETEIKNNGAQPDVASAP